MTNTQLVLQTIQDHPEGLTDDEISDLSKVRPRQQVYQICVRLEAEGRIERKPFQREPGDRRKLHNFPVSGAASSVQARLTVTAAWERRLNALIAATGKQREQILDEALTRYAMSFLKSTSGGGTEDDESN